MREGGMPGRMELLLHRPGSTSRWNRHGPHSELPLPEVGRAPTPGTSLPLLHAQALAASWGVFGKGESSGVREGQGMRMELGGKGGIFVIRNQDVPHPHPDKDARGNVLDVLAWHRVVYTSQGAFGT